MIPIQHTLPKNEHPNHRRIDATRKKCRINSNGKIELGIFFLQYHSLKDKDYLPSHPIGAIPYEYDPTTQGLFLPLLPLQAVPGQCQRIQAGLSGVQSFGGQQQAASGYG